jgi:pimeloyl-ACP methyl ester carboxylesterase
VSTRPIANHFGCKACWPAFQLRISAIKAFSETDQTKDLKKIDVPTLILHGDDDQIVPIQASALQSVKLIKGAELKIYKGAPHENVHDPKRRGKCRPPQPFSNEGICPQEACGVADRHRAF